MEDEDLYISENEDNIPEDL
jgi:cystathionine beta-lyase/cystathionine gamma-synthase